MNYSPRLFAIASFSLCVSLNASIHAVAQTNSTATSNPKPGSLSLTKLDDTTALVEATFAVLPNENRVDILVGDQISTFTDDGRNGDQKAGDGIFSTTIAFDFDAFAKANLQLANNASREKDFIFAPGDRQVIGSQQAVVSSTSLGFTTQIGEKIKTFSLPTDAKQISPGQAIALPLLGKTIGLPADISISSAAAVNIPKSLMITSTSVVNDPTRTWACKASNTTPVGNPTGEWTFWQLMENISNGTAPTSDYIKALFKHWTVTQTINTFAVPPRNNVFNDVIKQWEIRSGGAGAALKPNQSPFRLLGIVLRIDLRGGTGPYAAGEAGEARFVFALHDGKCNNKSMTLIMEYKVPIAGCTNIRSWAQKWKALASSSNYNNDLASLTQVFAAAGANPVAPNQSAIGQIRTNEFLAGSPFWQEREFVLPKSGGFLGQTDVKQEPDNGFNNSSLLASYLNANWPLLVGPPPAQHTIPLSFLGNPFAGGSSPVPTVWNAPAALLTVPTTPAPVTPPPATIRDDALFQLAVNTCSGCHRNETGTPFAHLDYNSPPGNPALLSGFLTGITVNDARNSAIPRSFNDLARRAADLNVAATMSCEKKAAFGNLLISELTSPAPVKFVH